MSALTFRFPGKSPSAQPAGGTVTARVPLAGTDSALSPSGGRDYIVPTPKEFAWTGANMRLAPEMTIFVGTKPGEEIDKAAAFLSRDLTDLYGVKSVAVKRAEYPASGGPSGAIILGETPRHTSAADLCQAAGVAVPDQPEGYAVSVDATRAVVAAKTARGVFNGAMTLAQTAGATTEGAVLRGAKVRDWPAMGWRGVHCLSGKGAGDEIARALRDLMARFKLNNLVWEVQYINWDSTPKIHHPRYGMDKSDARKVVEAAKAVGIDITPLIQSLGHSEWIFVNNQNLDIAEDPERPYAYCPTNPKTYEFIFKVYGEALDFFHPKTFHIGHDEVTMRGRFPWRSKDSGKSVTDLFIEDTRKLHEWFAKRGVKVMMWGDMMVYKTEAPDAQFAPNLEEAKRRRDGLPKDITIADWHYAAVDADKFKSIGIFKAAGFAVLGCGWYSMDNIRYLAKACADAKAEGYMQTT